MHFILVTASEAIFFQLDVRGAATGNWHIRTSITVSDMTRPRRGHRDETAFGCEIRCVLPFSKPTHGTSMPSQTRSAGECYLVGVSMNSQLIHSQWA